MSNSIFLNGCFLAIYWFCSFPPRGRSCCFTSVLLHLPAVLFRCSVLPLMTWDLSFRPAFSLFSFTLQRWKWNLFSCVQLFATPWTVALQVPLSMEFSRQKYWSGWPFPLCFMPIGWCLLYIWGYWYFSPQSWFQLVFLPVQHFSWCTLHIITCI